MFVPCLFYLFLVFSCFLPSIWSQTINEIILDQGPLKQYTTSCSTYTYFKVYFPYACRDLNITVYPSYGEPDVFVSKNVMYPTNSGLSWAASADLEYTVSISHWDPNSSPGYYFISVYDDCTKQSNPTEYTISAISYDDPITQGDDLFLYPELGLNQITTANAYRYFRFCIPECSDVTVTLTNCLNNTICPEAYSFPELLVSRTDVNPTINDYSFKLAQIYRRYITINYTDPAARDLHGYNPGSYYVGVFGYCTPQEYVQNNATDGPCAYAKTVLFNVTVNVATQPTPACNSSHLIYPSEPNYPLIESGYTYRGYVECNDYTYYTIQVPNPCYDLNIFITTTYQTTIKAPELAVGKYPNTIPTFANLEWTSYNWAFQNLTVDAWDPNFDGGYVCGRDGKSLCEMYIGVYGYCVDYGTDDYYNVPVEFEMTATLIRQHKIFNVPQTNQIIKPASSNFYEFCVASEADSKAQLLTWTDACDCPHNYTDLEMVISKTNRVSTTSDLVWRVEHTDTRNKEIDLLTSDTDTRPGTYYLNVYGYCTETSSCGNTCTCAPCTNIENGAQYALFVNYTTPIDSYESNLNKYLGSCPGSTDSSVKLESSVCESVCVEEDTTSNDGNSSDNHELSNGGKIAIIVIFVLIGFALVVIGSIYYFKVLNQNKGSYGSAQDFDAAPVLSKSTDLEVTRIYSSGA